MSEITGQELSSRRVSPAQRVGGIAPWLGQAEVPSEGARWLEREVGSEPAPAGDGLFLAQLGGDACLLDA